MKKVILIAIAGCLILAGCKSSNTYEKPESSVEEQLDDKNRTTLPLAQQITKIPGVILRGGVPVFQRVANDRSKRGRNIEPLYVVNGVPVGSSYRGLVGVVNSTQVKDIEGIIGPEASTYGGRGSNGVIVITTY